MGMPLDWWNGPPDDVDVDEEWEMVLVYAEAHDMDPDDVDPADAVAYCEDDGFDPEPLDWLGLPYED